jgi:hypothetical protein
MGESLVFQEVSVNLVEGEIAVGEGGDPGGFGVGLKNADKLFKGPGGKGLCFCEMGAIGAEGREGSWQ